jgi:hypothetical protein
MQKLPRSRRAKVYVILSKLPSRLHVRADMTVLPPLFNHGGHAGLELGELMDPVKLAIRAPSIELH